MGIYRILGMAVGVRNEELSTTIIKIRFCGVDDFVMTKQPCLLNCLRNRVLNCRF